MRARICLSCWIPCLLLLAAGCGESDVSREAVSGTVTLDGKPLPQGSILFTPLGEGPSAGGEIVDGRYTLPQHLGAGPGKYRVELNSWRPTGRITHDEATGMDDEHLISIIPKRYNQRSELEVEIQSDGKNSFDFELESK